MKRKLVRYYLLFALLIPELKVLAQSDHNFHSGEKAFKQSELFPNKIIRSRNKYVYNKKRIKQGKVCLILKEKNDKEINLQLQDAKRKKRTSNISYLIAIPATIAGIGFMVTGMGESFDPFQTKTKEQLAAAKTKKDMGVGFSLVSFTALVVATSYSIKSKRAVRSAIKLYNQKY